MKQSFFFYDLETSGFSPSDQRIMQFAGLRTDMDLNIIGKPVNQLLALTNDILPDPQAILVTGITPQQTISDGCSEAEFLHKFYKSIAIPGTIFVGFNNIRFDDEFIRYLNYRNFYDAYEWHWQDQRSRWDLLDVVRMTRALRPQGINWPVDDKNVAVNRLEALTQANNIDHQKAHDALSDVKATIDLARLLKTKQTKLFNYLLTMRDKQKVENLVRTNKPFVYSSGKYSPETEKTAVVLPLVDNPKSGVLVYDLRYNPKNWFGLSAERLADVWGWKENDTQQRLPIKTLQFNRCPAVAPLSVLDIECKKRLKITDKIINNHSELLRSNKQFVDNVLSALSILNKQQQERRSTVSAGVDGRLYDSFISSIDKSKMRVVHNATDLTIDSLKINFQDKRLNELFPLYKARNFPNLLSGKDLKRWEAYRSLRLLGGDQNSRAANYFHTLEDMKKQKLDNQQKFLLEELNLYAQSILPEVS